MIRLLVAMLGIFTATSFAQAGAAAIDMTRWINRYHDCYHHLMNVPLVYSQTHPPMALSEDKGNVELLKQEQRYRDAEHILTPDGKGLYLVLDGTAIFVPLKNPTPFGDATRFYVELKEPGRSSVFLNITIPKTLPQKAANSDNISVVEASFHPGPDQKYERVSSRGLFDDGFRKLFNAVLVDKVKSITDGYGRHRTFIAEKNRSNVKRTSYGMRLKKASDPKEAYMTTADVENEIQECRRWFENSETRDPKDQNILDALVAEDQKFHEIYGQPNTENGTGVNKPAGMK